MKEAQKKYVELFQQMSSLCTKQGWGEPFSFARSKEILAACKLNHKISDTLSGADAFNEFGEPVEYKSTTGRTIKGSYTGISVQPTWEEQEKYLREDKILKYPEHYFHRFEDGKLVESWVLTGQQVYDILLPKLKRKYPNVLKLKDPRLSANVSTKEIESQGKRVVLKSGMTKTIDSKKVLYSKGNNDECYTPVYGVEPILEYIPEGAIVWCPFDEEHSEFVKLISKQNRVVHSHLNEDKDFFEWEPEEWDVIISNPPFTNKRKFFERALSFNKPFALIMTNTWLNDSAPKQLFKGKDLQLLMFDKRMRFISPDGRDNDKITFSSSYYCWNFLPKQIVMKELKIPKN